MKAIKEYITNVFQKRHNNSKESRIDNYNQSKYVNQTESLTSLNEFFLSQLCLSYTSHFIPDFNYSYFQKLPIEHLKSYYHNIYSKFKKSFVFISSNHSISIFNKYKENFNKISLSNSKNIIDQLDKAKESTEKITQLNYNQFKTISIEYNDSVSKANQKLIENNNKVVDLLIKQKKNKDEVQLNSLIRNTYSQLISTYDNYFNDILRKIKCISSVNQRHQQRLNQRMNVINSYSNLINDSNSSASMLQKRNSLKRLLINNTGKDNKFIEEMITNGFISKKQAITLVKGLGSYYWTIKDSLKGSNSSDKSYFNRLVNAFANLYLTIKTKHNIISDLTSNDTNKLECNLKEFERYLISQSKQHIIKQLYLYCYTSKLNNEILKYFTPNNYINTPI